jgi:hypothetical protein
MSTFNSQQWFKTFILLWSDHVFKTSSHIYNLDCVQSHKIKHFNDPDTLDYLINIQRNQWV